VRILLFANTDWYLYNFRQPLAHALREKGHEVMLVSPPGPYGAKLLEMGYRWQPAPMDRRSLNPLREYRLLRWLRRLIAEEKLDLVHGFTIKCAVYGSIAARLEGVPARVNAVAGMGYVFTSEAVKARMLRPFVSQLLRYALAGEGTRLILQNPDDVRMFAEARLADADRIRLIPGSGVDCTRFFPGPRATQSDGSFRVLLPARLLWDKGVAEFVEASRLLQKQGVRVEFLLAGEPDPGNPASVPPDLVREWEEEGLVRWLGHVHDMPALFNTVDAVVLPSYREGLPKGLIEAAASALPLITTDVPGCREVVTHEVEGLLVRPRDAQDLARAILVLRNNADLCRRFGTAARQKALARFDERSVIQRTLDVYRELLPDFG
jgi:glycosyltransferase involved in cell wall biosynthesis